MTSGVLLVAGLVATLATDQPVFLAVGLLMGLVLVFVPDTPKNRPSDSYRRGW